MKTFAKLIMFTKCRTLNIEYCNVLLVDPE